MKRRVVITGMGVISPVGNDLDTFWNHLLAGKSGISHIEGYDTTAYPTKIAGQVKNFNPDLYMDKDLSSQLDRYQQFAVAAAKMAVEDANLNVQRDADPERVGVIIGCGFGGSESWQSGLRGIRKMGDESAVATLIPKLAINTGASLVSMLTGAKGPSSAIVTACAASTHSMGDSFRMIQYGEADVMICGGAEASVLPAGLGGFSTMKATSTRNEEPEKASRPFDLGRDGFVMGEGAGILVLESLEHAQKRGARIYAELIGYAMTSDSYHMVEPSPSGDGAACCMRNALRDAGIDPTDVQYVNTHGTSTPAGDKAETLALKKTFGDHAYKLAVNSTKSMTGHLVGAAGAVEAIVCGLVITRGEMPPTINQETPD
ncbi:MAG: beta-ketoacyl-ACP synthase II, partial [Tumebacillaceae bacterium]